MRIKSYFAGTVEAAMDRARRELGEDAVLLHAHAAPPDARHLGIHEVVFGVETAAQQLPAAPAVPAAPAAQAPKEIRSQRPATEGSEALAEFLIDRDFPAALAQQLAAEVAARAQARLRPGWPPETLRPETLQQQDGPLTREFRRKGLIAELLLETLGEHLPIHSAAPGAITIFYGPAGAGKTSLLVKLAATWSLRKRITILSTDTVRIGAADQLRTYAGILGVDCEVCETPAALEQALAGCLRQRPDGLVLVDTPGWTAQQLAAEAEPWMRYHSEHSQHSQHSQHYLVIPATLGRREFAATVDRFSPFGITALALTHADELIAGGALAGSLAAADLPTAFLSTGPSIPEDWTPASAAVMCELILTGTDPNMRGTIAREPLRRVTQPPAPNEPKQYQTTHRELTHV